MAALKYERTPGGRWCILTAGDTFAMLTLGGGGVSAGVAHPQFTFELRISKKVRRLGLLRHSGFVRTPAGKAQMVVSFPRVGRGRPRYSGWAETLRAAKRG